MDSLKEHVQSIIKAYLLENIAKLIHVPIHKINPAISFFEFGLDSLHFQQLITKLENWSGLTLLSENFPPDCNTINKLAEYIATLYMSGGSQSNTAPSNNASMHKHTEPQPIQPKDSLHQQALTIKHANFFTSTDFQDFIKRREELGLSSPQKNIFFDQHEGIANNKTIIQGREMSSYASYNYLGLSGQPSVGKAAIQAIKKYGTSVSASRLVSGEKPIHRQLEQSIAKLIGTEDCVVFNSGHATNVNVISHLFGPNDLIYHDEYAHNSIIQGAIFSRATRLSFPHNNWQALEELLSNQIGTYDKFVIILEGVYSMDGDIPNLPEFIRIKNKYHGMLMIDEAHSIGVLGKQGGGIREYYDVPANSVDLWMGTLSKALSSCGGYIACQQDLAEYLKYTCPGFVYSVGITPHDTAAALAAIEYMEQHPELLQKLQDISQYARKLALKYGFNIGTSKNTPIIPIIIGNSKKCIELSLKLLDEDINIKPVIYPAVPEGLARLRLFLTSKHTKKQIKHTFDVLKKLL